MSAVRLRVSSVPPVGTIPRYWVAQLYVSPQALPMMVGGFDTWSEAITEGCVAGRLQAAGISWASSPPPEPEPPTEWQELVATPADAVGLALPELPPSAYADDAVELEDHRATPPLQGEPHVDPAAVTYGSTRTGADVLAYLESIRRRDQ